MKLAVAPRLAAVVNQVYNNYELYNGGYYLIAAVAYSLYIYADFSSYSDMACGIASLMGFEIKRNF